MLRAISLEPLMAVKRLMDMLKINAMSSFCKSLNLQPRGYPKLWGFLFIIFSSLFSRWRMHKLSCCYTSLGEKFQDGGKNSCFHGSWLKYQLVDGYWIIGCASSQTQILYKASRTSLGMFEIIFDGFHKEKKLKLWWLWFIKIRWQFQECLCLTLKYSNTTVC